MILARRPERQRDKGHQRNKARAYLCGDFGSRYRWLRLERLITEPERPFLFGPTPSSRSPLRCPQMLEQIEGDVVTAVERWPLPPTRRDGPQAARRA